MFSARPYLYRVFLPSAATTGGRICAVPARFTAMAIAEENLQWDRPRLAGSEFHRIWSAIRHGRFYDFSCASEPDDIIDPCGFYRLLVEAVPAERQYVDGPV
jgi:hypothetical protein